MYSKPQLERFGSLREITQQGMFGFGKDGFGIFAAGAVKSPTTRTS